MRVSTGQAALGMYLICFVSIGCASGGTKSIGQAGPVSIALKAEVGQEDVTRYYSHSRVKSFEGAQLVRERDEMVEFRVRERVSNIEPGTGHLTIKTETIQKDGIVDLHDLAFPEKGEEIEYVMSRQGEVLRAGAYPPDTVFYVPPIPLPKGPVEIGDTWTLDHAWIGMKNEIPLGVHLVAILKDISECGKGRCADIEVSGNVEVIGIAPQKAQFTSVLWGRMLIAVERGTVIWSEMRSREKMTVPNSRTDVLSCMVAELETPKGWRPRSASQTCTPSEAPVTKIP